MNPATEPLLNGEGSLSSVKINGAPPRRFSPQFVPLKPVPRAPETLRLDLQAPAPPEQTHLHTHQEGAADKEIAVKGINEEDFDFGDLDFDFEFDLEFDLDDLEVVVLEEELSETGLWVASTVVGSPPRLLSTPPSQELREAASAFVSEIKPPKKFKFVVFFLSLPYLSHSYSQRILTRPVPSWGERRGHWSHATTTKGCSHDRWGCGCVRWARVWQDQGALLPGGSPDPREER